MKPFASFVLYVLSIAVAVGIGMSQVGVVEISDVSKGSQETDLPDCTSYELSNDCPPASGVGSPCSATYSTFDGGAPAGQALNSISEHDEKMLVCYEDDHCEGWTGGDKKKDEDCVAGDDVPPPP